MEYIRYRLEKSGGQPDLFSPEAMALVQQASFGVPRSINLICGSALLYAFADQVRSVGPEHVSQVVEDRSGLGGAGQKQPWERLEPGLNTGLNSGQETGSISKAAFSFIVQEPSGIIDAVSDRSRDSSRLR